MCIRDRPNLSNMVDAAGAIVNEYNIHTLEKYHVLSRVECESRYEILLENYAKIILIEANTMIDMVRQQILPSVISFTGKCADSFNRLRDAGIENRALHDMVKRLSQSITNIMGALSVLQHLSLIHI